MLATATARKPIQIGRTTYYYNQPDQYTYQFEFEDGRYLGQITRVPQSAHEKEHYIPGTTQEHKPFWREATEALIREYWETQAMQVRAAPEPEIPATFRELPAPEPEPAPPAPAEEWVTIAEAERRLKDTARFKNVYTRVRAGFFTTRKTITDKPRWEILWPGDAAAEAIMQRPLPPAVKAPKAVAPPPAVQLPLTETADPPKNGHIVSAPAEQWHTLAEAAARLGVGEDTVRSRMRAGEFTKRIAGVPAHYEILWPGDAEAAVIVQSLVASPETVAAQEQQILAYMQDHAVITRQECADLLRVSPSIATHRMSILARAGRLRQVGGGNRIQYILPQFDVAHGSREQKMAEILHYVQQHGSITNRECPELFSISRHQAQKWLANLVAAGKLTRQAAGVFVLPIVPTSEPTEPEPAPLADFPSPTIEVQHTSGADDHPLDSLPAVETDRVPAMAPALEYRKQSELLDRLQAARLEDAKRIGYLEALVAYWREQTRIGLDAAREHQSTVQALADVRGELAACQEQLATCHAHLAPSPAKRRWWQL